MLLSLHIITCDDGQHLLWGRACGAHVLPSMTSLLDVWLGWLLWWEHLSCQGLLPPMHVWWYEGCLMRMPSCACFQGAHPLSCVSSA
jgi:hypothetical protein